MDEQNPFADVLARLRAHNQAAAAQFVEVYGPVILRVIGRRLSRRRLSRELDPADIAQQVFTKFFSRVAKGFEIGSSEDVVKLLASMTRHEIADADRHAHRKRRGGRKHHTQHSHLEEIVSPGDKPNHDLIEQEDLDHIHKLMSPEEWELAMDWASGRTWHELAAEFGQSADALRKKFYRAIARIKGDRKTE